MSSFLSLGLVAALAMLLTGQSEGTGLREAHCLDNMGPDGPSLEAFSGKGRELSLCVREYRKKYGQDFKCGRNLRGRTCVQIKDHFQSFLDDLRRCLQGPTTISPPPTPTTPLAKPRDCRDLFDTGVTGDAERVIFPTDGMPVDVRCINASTVIVNRDSLSFGFNNTFAEYAEGFGNITEDFYIGNEILNKLTSAQNYTLAVDIVRLNGEEQWANYTTFRVGPAADNYTLTVSGYDGNAGDALSVNNGRRFSTYDDAASSEEAGLSSFFGGGFWYLPQAVQNLAVLTLIPNNTFRVQMSWGEVQNDFIASYRLSLERP